MGLIRGGAGKSSRFLKIKPDSTQMGIQKTNPYPKKDKKIQLLGGGFERVLQVHTSFAHPYISERMEDKRESKWVKS